MIEGVLGELEPEGKKLAITVPDMTREFRKNNQWCSRGCTKYGGQEDEDQRASEYDEEEDKERDVAQTTTLVEVKIDPRSLALEVAATSPVARTSPSSPILCLF